MKRAKIFSNGRSQAVRLSKEYRLNGEEVYIKKYDNIIMQRLGLQFGAVLGRFCGDQKSARG